VREKRQYRRIGLDTVVDYSAEKKAQAKNISEGGLCLVTNHYIGKGTLLFLIISLTHKGIIQVIGESIWCRKKEECTYENGISFFCLDDFNLQKIREYIESED
jgi:Tfp pilus assembly protein PilZ